MQRFRYRRASHVLHRGGIIAYPTEGVFGLGCDPQNSTAVNRLLQLKRRSVAKGLILLAAHRSQLAGYLGPLDKAMEARLQRSWPGPVTWIVPAGGRAASWLTGGRNTLAVRVTAHPVASNLCRAFGAAIVSTSANLAGSPPARTALRVRLLFGNDLDAIVHGATGGMAGPTEVRDVRDGSILRPG